MKLSDFVIEFLKTENIKHVFFYPGGAITHLIDSLYMTSGIQGIVVHHEQAGAFAAEAYARINGNIGVAMATSGPGATNLITGIASSYFDSIPCLYITGQVNTYEYKFDKPVRQIGFQETDIVSIVKPITKDSFIITDPQKIKYFLQKAIYIAQSGRPGPVLLDIPMDIQRAEVDINNLESFQYPKQSERTISEETIHLIVDKMSKAKRPVFLVGGGIRLANATEALFQLVNKTQIPIVTSLMGLDAFPHNHPCFCGMLGAYGNRYANFTVANSDLLIVLGSRLTSRQTSNKPETFARAAEIIHVDIDPLELGRRNAELSICSDVNIFLKHLNDHITQFNNPNLKEWIRVTQLYKKRFPSFDQQENVTSQINPNYFMHILSELLTDEYVICLDVGQNQIWAAQSLELKQNQRMLISGGMGAMGFALPAAIGAYKASGKKVIAIVGDGGIQMNIQELQTIVRNHIPVKIILMNNGCLGMIRHFQELYFEGRYNGTINGYDDPNFEDIALAYKLKYYSINENQQIASVLSTVLENDEITLVEVKLPKFTYVIPKLEMGRPIEDQSPLLDREEFKRNMIIKPLDL